MRGESVGQIVHLPRRTVGTGVPTNFGRENLSLFGRVCRECWPNERKLDVFISQETGCTDRAARQYLKGERKPSVDALLLVFNKIRRD